MRPIKPRLVERRQAERRRAVAAARAPAQEESWFGAVGVSTAVRDDAWNDEAESRFERGWHGPGEDAPADSRFLSRQAQRIVRSGVSAFERLYIAFLAARVALGLALLVAQIVAAVFGGRPALPIELVCGLYALEVVALALFEHMRRRPSRAPMTRLGTRQWLATIGVDSVCFLLLHLFGTASGLNYVPLLVLPVLMAGVLTPRRIALATAAGIALVLLGGAWFNVIADAGAALPITQAGLVGIGFFVITLLTGELAGRLAREELTARGSLELARQQAQLNRLVIEEMQDGVLVVDRKGRVRAANPAARGLLAPSGLAPAAPFQLRGESAWEPLVTAVERAFAEAEWPEAGRDVRLAFSPTLSRTVRLRVRFTRRREPQSSEEVCVLFVEDVRSVQARTRQEKLAAMGRVSAGIAHEIRNPLAAIAQANALLAEDATDAGQQRLTQMVSENVERLKRIVDDVLQVAPGNAQAAGAIDARRVVSEVCAEWARGAGIGIGDGGTLDLALPDEPLGVVFDPEHLRRVLVNLLDNARRHAGDAPGAIALALAREGERQVLLSVASGDEVIAPEVERHLFEPFFSTRSRGTGLGLYICRELCQRYGGSIEYRPRAERDARRNEFVVLMRRAAAPAALAAESRSLFA
jgi:two-component system sensor histidine kinase PilS (NtrC family)